MEDWRHSVPSRIGRSNLLPQLAKFYAFVPSAIIFRVPEAEILRAVPMIRPTLDLCCGDGFFASLISPSGFDAGCDFNQSALNKAAQRRLYSQLACNDITQGLSFPDNTFNTIISNSSLEHVKDIDRALCEVYRVLKPGGLFYTTFASSFAYEWWLGSSEGRKRYLDWQPVYNYFSYQDWCKHFASAGLNVIDHAYYLSKMTSQIAMLLDYHFSRTYLTSDKGRIQTIIRAMRRVPAAQRVWPSIWRLLFAASRILTGKEQGGGILLVAEKR
ncbi:MAG TPA: class I SAM-dependent methyltransferase [Aggregatilineaceae bacterium]|nr:class I SAM-dependent methyltransferase [Aggregatilineaceae bacterium]